MRDGLLHTVVGFADYEIKGSTRLPVDPLGPAFRLGYAENAGRLWSGPQRNPAQCAGAH